MITFIKQDTRLKLSPWINLHNILHVLSHRGKLLTEWRRWFPELGHPLSLTNACVASSVPLKIAFDVRRSPGFDFQETGLWWGLQHLRVDGWNGCQPALEQGQLVLWECTPPSLLLLFETKDTWSLGMFALATGSSCQDELNNVLERSSNPTPFLHRVGESNSKAFKGHCHISSRARSVSPICDS